MKNIANGAPSAAAPTFKYGTRHALFAVRAGVGSGSGAPRGAKD